MTSPATTDLCDAHPEIQVCEPVFQIFGGNVRFSGPITTVKLFEDNTLIKQAVESPGEGRVLVVDGGGSKRCGVRRPRWCGPVPRLRSRHPRRTPSGRRPGRRGWTGTTRSGWGT